MEQFEVILSFLNSDAMVDVFVRLDDIALEGTEEIELHLVPLPPWNGTARLVIQNTIKLSIIDSDSMLSISHTTVEVLEPSQKF